MFRDDAESLACARARLTKALRIEAALRRAGCNDSTAARALDREGRRNAEAAAGVRLASEMTWTMVYVLLDSERPCASVAACQGRALDELAGVVDDGNGMLVAAGR